jgi:hypothetical protein
VSSLPEASSSAATTDGPGRRHLGMLSSLRRRAEIVGEAALGIPALVRWRLSRGRRPPDPRGSQCWVPLHSLLGRRGLLGATTPEERAFCEWYARAAYRGAGAIVDLGSWLGSTTLPLARGMSHRDRRRGTRIHAYDRFIWEEWMTEFAEASGVRLDYRPGDDFRRTFEDALGPHLRLVDIHTADLCVERWSGGPIELIVIDAMKSWELAENILRQFLTHLAGGGVIFHQDFAHYYTPWIHLIGYRLRDHFTIFYDVPKSDAVAFRLRRSLDRVDAAVLASPNSYGPEEVTAAFRHSRGLVRADKHAAISAAEAMFYVNLGDLERASEVLRSSAHLGPADDLAAVERLLREARSDPAGGGAPE